jgi:hypothetical protein
MIFGLDQLGLAKYADLAAAEHPSGWALGAFSNVFGDALPGILKVISTGRCPRVRIHLHWEDDHREKPDTFRKIEAEAKRVAAFISKHPRIEWRVSGFCEHQLTIGKAKQLKSLVMKHMPQGVEYVNSPWLKGGGQTIPGDINEVHGADASIPRGRYDFSFDGTGAFDADVEAYKKKFSSSETFYLWYSGCNGRLNDEDKTPRPQRTAWPTSRYIDSLIYLSTSRGAVNVPADWIFKSHSDRHTTPPEPRAGKPVIIAPDVGKIITFTTVSGQQIARAEKGDLFRENRPGKPKRYIYRINDDWGYLLSEKANRIQNSPVVQIRINNKTVGSLNLAFRGGTFRG